VEADDDIKSAAFLLSNCSESIGAIDILEGAKGGATAAKDSKAVGGPDSETLSASTFTSATPDCDLRVDTSELDRGLSVGVFCFRTDMIALFEVHQSKGNVTKGSTIESTTWEATKSAFTPGLPMATATMVEGMMASRRVMRRRTKGLVRINVSVELTQR
jgi:hypothetical protein